MTKNSPHTFDDLIGIMAKLRSDSGCPWDRKQTHKTLIPYLREEAEEVIENIEKNALGNDLKEELGDILLQVIFHAQLAAEEGRFDIYGIVDTLAGKLIRRHPHVFGDEKADNPEDVTRIWQRIKKQEKES